MITLLIHFYSRTAICISVVGLNSKDIFSFMVINADVANTANIKFFNLFILKLSLFCVGLLTQKVYFSLLCNIEPYRG